MPGNVLLIRNVAQYSAVNLIAGAGILGNVGGVALASNIALGNAISAYASIPVVSRYANIVSLAAANANSAITFGTTSTAAPWLTNSLPAAYSNIYGTTMTNAITAQAGNIMGGGDLGKFDQVFSQASGLIATSNELIKSAQAANSQSTAISFVNVDNTITSGVSSVTEAFAAFAQDLRLLGRAINLANLNNLGSPQALVRQLLLVSTLPSGLRTAMLAEGIAKDNIDALARTDLSLADEKRLYVAMTKITGQTLLEVLSVLRVQTPGLETMADLLNPVKTFPNSFDTFSAPTTNGYRGIYINSSGAVNSNLATTLPPSVLIPLDGNPLQNLEPRQQA